MIALCHTSNKLNGLKEIKGSWTKPIRNEGSQPTAWSRITKTLYVGLARRIAAASFLFTPYEKSHDGQERIETKGKG